VGFSKIYWQGSEYKSNLMIIDLLGPSIEDLFVMCNKKFSLKTTLMLADQFVLFGQLRYKEFNGYTPRITFIGTLSLKTILWD